MRGDDVPLTDIPRIDIHGLLAKLQGVQQHGENWQAKCPAHDDSTASLSLKEGRNGGVLLKCFAGCTFKSICDAVGVNPTSLGAPRPVKSDHVTSAIYDYRGLDGSLRYQVCRMQPKKFYQRQPNPAGGWIMNMNGVRRIPYRLNELKDKATIYVVEGEKDANNLWTAGLPATTNVSGAGKWVDSYSEDLLAAGVRRAVLLPDNDAPGKKHMDDVARSLKQYGIHVQRILLPDMPPKSDVSDWLALGHTAAELEALTERTPFVVSKNAPPEPPPNPEDDPTRWPLSELGAAEAFAEQQGSNVRFDHAQERWLLWDEHIWRPDADNAVHRLAHTHIRTRQEDTLARVRDPAARTAQVGFLLKLERRAGVENVLAFMKSLKPIADRGDAWDSNSWLFGVANGVIDLKTGELRDGRRDDGLTVQTPTRFDAASACPRWLQFLSDVFEDDAAIIGYIQRAIGYSLTGDMREQCFFMLVGGGSNGKSTFTSTLERVLGKYAYTTDMRTFTTNQQNTESGFDLAELANRRLILASETKSDARLNEQALKNFTGGEKMNAQRKYGHPFEYTPTGKIWLGLNHQPRVKDDSYGFWRRVRLIHFNRTFTGSNSNPNLRAELLEEAPGILAWAVRGCLEWQKDGLLPPPSVFTATDAYQQAEDPLNDFILECCEIAQSEMTPAAGAYKAYQRWEDDQGFTLKEKMTAHAFGRLFSRRFERKHTEHGKRYVGVRVKLRPKDLLEGVY